MMRRLADGDAAQPVPGLGRGDEIGSMAASVQVFKDTFIRTHQLEEETALARASAEAQRKAGMRDMADRFEQAVGGIVGMVSSSATELQVTAQQMTATAQQTAKATEEIRQQIGQIQGVTGQAVTAIGGITGRIREIDDVSASIAAAVEQQGAGRVLDPARSVRAASTAKPAAKPTATMRVPVAGTRALAPALGALLAVGCRNPNRPGNRR